MSTDTAPKYRALEAVAMILASVTAMAFADAMVKLLSGEMTLWQIFACRSAVAVPVLLAMLYRAGIRLRPRAPIWVALRSLLLLGTWIAYYASLPYLTLSAASVAVYTSPLIIVLFAGAFLRERVGAGQWAGVAAGFLGVIAIARPGTEAFTPAVLLPLLGAFGYALAMVLTGARCRDENPLVLSLGMNAAILIAGIVMSAVLAVVGGSGAANPFLLGPWTAMDGTDWATLALLGVLIAQYAAGVGRAYQIAPASLVAAFDYGYLVAAALWGFLLFQEVPDGQTLAGMALITLGGLLVIGRRR